MMKLRLSEIWIYPIKSLGGIRLKQARILEKGLEHDRRWMLVDEHGRFITQREHSELALFDVQINGNSLHILHRKNKVEHVVDMRYRASHPVPVSIWKDVVTATEVQPETSRWFSDQLNLPCKLVFFPEENARPVDPAYALKNENVSLADAYPFLLIGQASLDDLNTRLTEPVTMQRFRPNFVFTGGQPYEEDQWKNFSIGNNRFVGVKLCARCTLTTVNPVTGIKGVEPLRTLAAYRNQNGKVNFGQNVVALDTGLLTEGENLML